MGRNTIFSPCRTFRYTLWREFDCDLMTGCTDDSPNSSQYVNFIGLNPSTADEHKDDPTIRKCIRFATRWGYGALAMTNIFAFRATDPKVMKRHTLPVGPDNDQHLAMIAAGAGLVVCAWGNHGDHNQRSDSVRKLLLEVGAQVKCFRITGQGMPEHPLYQKDSAELIEFKL